MIRLRKSKGLFLNLWIATQGYALLAMTIRSVSCFVGNDGQKHALNLQSVQ